jgi:hypothetical protein
VQDVVDAGLEEVEVEVAFLVEVEVSKVLLLQGRVEVDVVLVLEGRVEVDVVLVLQGRVEVEVVDVVVQGRVDEVV